MLYLSRTIKAWSQPELERLVDACQTRNTQDGLTGLLLYGNGGRWACSTSTMAPRSTAIDSSGSSLRSIGAPERWPPTRWLWNC